MASSSEHLLLRETKSGDEEVDFDEDTAQEAREMSTSEQEEETYPHLLDQSRGKKRDLKKRKLPLGALLLEHTGVFKFHTYRRYKDY